MKTLLPLVFLMLTSAVSFSQTKDVSVFYKNGLLCSKGKELSYSLICEDRGYSRKITVKKKTGTWTYYYENGAIKRVESYKKIKDCNPEPVADGKWQYWSPAGDLLREEIYHDGLLTDADVAISYGSENVGHIIIRDSATDTVFSLPHNTEDDGNLIKNSSFELYRGKPVLIFQDGTHQIEDDALFWLSPDKNTPDYYNPFRKIIENPDNLSEDTQPQHGEGYAGIILYNKTHEMYSEYITGKLNTPVAAGKKYAVQVTLCLSQNAGYAIDRFGVYLSKEIPVIKNSDTRLPYNPQLVFTIEPQECKKWITLSGTFISESSLSYITVGRFSGTDEITVTANTPMNKCGGQINQSAYYLFDNIVLTEDTSSTVSNDINSDYIDSSGRTILFDSVSVTVPEALDSDVAIILDNIRFDFNRSDILPSSVAELEKLKSFLLKNEEISIVISGHTDNIGTEGYNNNLSLERARAVCTWLVSNGIEENRLRHEGYGATRPLESNETDYGRSRNRRVEFRIMQDGVESD